MYSSFRCPITIKYSKRKIFNGTIILILILDFYTFLLYKINFAKFNSAIIGIIPSFVIVYKEGVIDYILK